MDANDDRKTLPWWFTPLLGGLIIFATSSTITVDAYPFYWPIFAIGFLSVFVAELLVRAANAVLRHWQG